MACAEILIKGVHDDCDCNTGISSIPVVCQAVSQKLEAPLWCCSGTGKTMGRSPKVFASLALLYGASDRRASSLKPAFLPGFLDSVNGIIFLSTIPKNGTYQY